MPVLKVKKNGIWQELSGSSPADGGDADTLDGKHADEFASASEVEALQAKVGDTSVSEQISSAVGAINIPVTSVNGKTGAVELTASDVGALPSTTVIPSTDGLATETYVDDKVANVTIDAITDDEIDSICGEFSTDNVTGADQVYVKKSGDTMSGALAMGGNKITGLATPTNSEDAVNKAYVDSLSFESPDVELPEAVLYVEQTLTEEQKTQVLANIGAASRSDVSAISNEIVPDYWLTTLQDGAEAINAAMLEAGYNKSAFLFYSDAHWNLNSKVSPALLKYLYQHTAMTKTIFGGDIVSAEATDYDTMSYLWEWRNMLKGLPNHHSVVGNHDDGQSTNNLFDEKYVYAFLLAAEETPDIVRGDSGIYYYIDSPAEKTRYLYLDTAYKGVDDAQTTFITNALKGTESGWHIVVVAHAWYQPDYSSTVRPIPITGFHTNVTELVTLLDNYNARQDVFSDCDAKIEFCIGGHAHIDYDGTTPGGIPIILVEVDCNNIRSGLTYTKGTTTEASVNGIVADYTANQIHIIRVGRGSSRTVNIGS